MNTKENADISKAFNRLHLKTQTHCKCEAFHVVYASQEMSLCMLPEGHQYFEGSSFSHSVLAQSVVSQHHQRSNRSTTPILMRGKWRYAYEPPVTTVLFNSNLTTFVR